MNILTEAIVQVSLFFSLSLCVCDLTDFENDGGERMLRMDEEIGATGTSLYREYKWATETDRLCLDDVCRLRA